jgi:hypothetical protein
MSDLPDMQQLPPPPTADFSKIVEMFASQALAAMGKMPQAGSTVRMDYAKYFIDLLEVLQEKSKSNLTKDEDQALDGTLHYLRMLFIQNNKSS